MLFFIEYDRNRGDVITIQEFADLQKHSAETARLDLELEVNRLGQRHEVVLLEAASEEALRKTHRRYFENLSQLVKTS